MRRWQGLLLLILLGVPSCATTSVTVDGHELRENRWRDAESAVKSRASFDFNCPSEQITLTLLETTNQPYSFRYPELIGARGCGQQATYVSAGSTWVMDSERPAP